MKDLISFTSKALERLHYLIDKREAPPCGVRIGVRSGGCSGLSYVVEYADNHLPTDTIIEKDGIKILIDFKSEMFLVGTEMDYIEEKFKTGFVFRNPNSKGECGCGESFHT
jgi:iron-sulfur cluster assembly protein